MYHPCWQPVFLYKMPDNFLKFQITVPLFICLCHHKLSIICNHYIQQNPILLNYTSQKKKSHTHYSHKKNPLIHLKYMYCALTIPKNSANSCVNKTITWFLPRGHVKSLIRKLFFLSSNMFFKFYLKALKEH